MKPSLSVEISQKYLKMALMRPQASTPEFIVEAITDLSDREISDLISQAMRRMKLKSVETKISIPRNMVTVKNLHLPSKDPKEIEQMIDLHIGRLVPFKKEEILFGHQFLGIDNSGYADEMLAIVRQDIARRPHRILESAGVSVDKIMLSSYGAWQWMLANCRERLDKNELYLLLDVDWSFADLIIFNTHNLLFSRSISAEIGEDGLQHTDMAKLINEVKQSLIIFYNEALNKRPATIFISGSEAAQALKGKIESNFDIPVKYVVAPDSGKPPGEEAKRSVPKNVSLTAISEFAQGENPNRIVFGLPEIQIRKSLKEKMRELVILGTLFIYLLTLTIGFFLGRFYVKQSYLKNLKDQNALVRESVGEILEKAKSIEYTKDILSSRKVPLASLLALQKLIPPKISINYITIEEGDKITMRGQGLGLSDVFEFVSALEKSDYFKGAAAKYTRTKKIKDKEVTDFEIGMQSAI